MNPLIKWVGGKAKIATALVEMFPKEINNYYEPFVGGGSVLLTILQFIKEQRIKIKSGIYAYDVNEALIWMYKNVQLYPDDLYEQITVLKEGFYAAIDKQQYYYKIRDQYNDDHRIDKKSLLGSAMFIFLNKTCFRGLHRIGPNGFNVPYGNYKFPTIVNKEHLFKVSTLIQDVIFEVMPYSISCNLPESGDFIYMDPPYVPEEKTSFVGYNVKGFTNDDHRQLFKLCKKLQQKNILFIISNSDTTLIRKAFSKKKYNYYKVICPRRINSKTPNAVTTELIIMPILS